MIPKKPISAGLLSCLVAFVCLAAPAAGSAAPLYWGAQIGTQMTGTQAPYDMVPVTQFEGLSGKGLSLIGFTSPWSNCATSPCTPYVFPKPAMENARKYGAIPVLSWGSASSPESLHQPATRLKNIVAGKYDDYIRQFAIDAKNWGHPFFLRFDWEMNGAWFSWNEGVNGNKPGQFVAAWRHVHDIFTSVGATNATWVWCPNVNISGELRSLKSLYPGNRYVDWTGLDGFNWGVRHGSPGWLSFDEIFRKTYKEIVKLAPSKPMMIAETASSELGGNKAAWIKDTLKRVRTTYKKVRGFIWFDVLDRGTNWPIESSKPKAKKAFRAGIGNPAYRPNVFGGLPFGPIGPPA